MYLCTVGCGAMESVDSDRGLEFITSNGLQHKTFGVFTKCDSINSDYCEVLKSHVTGSDMDDQSDISHIQVS
jgi:hypothetical protein